MQYLENCISVLSVTEVRRIRQNVSSRSHIQTIDRILNVIWSIGYFSDRQQPKYLKRKEQLKAINDHMFVLYEDFTKNNSWDFPCAL